MKAELTFDLDDLDDRMAHLRCTKSLEMALLINAIDETLRRKIKYSEEDTEDIEKMRDEIQELKDSYGINTDELIN